MLITNVTRRTKADAAYGAAAKVTQHITEEIFHDQHVEMLGPHDQRLGSGIRVEIFTLDIRVLFSDLVEYPSKERHRRQNVAFIHASHTPRTVRRRAIPRPCQLESVPSNTHGSLSRDEHCVCHRIIITDTLPSRKIQTLRVFTNDHVVNLARLSLDGRLHPRQQLYRTVIRVRVQTHTEHPPKHPRLGTIWKTYLWQAHGALHRCICTLNRLEGLWCEVRAGPLIQSCSTFVEIKVQLEITGLLLDSTKHNQRGIDQLRTDPIAFDDDDGMVTDLNTGGAEDMGKIPLPQYTNVPAARRDGLLRGVDCNRRRTPSHAPGFPLCSTMTSSKR
jgi:hypothetical protein